MRKCQLTSGIIHPFGWTLTKEMDKKCSRLGMLQRAEHEIAAQHSHRVLPPNIMFDTAMWEKV